MSYFCKNKACKKIKGMCVHEKIMALVMVVLVVVVAYLINVR